MLKVMRAEEEKKRFFNQISQKAETLNYSLITNFNEYHNSKSKITLRCTCGNQYSIRADNFLHYDKLCKVCRSISS